MEAGAVRSAGDGQFRPEAGLLLADGGGEASRAGAVWPVAHADQFLEVLGLPLPFPFPRLDYFHLFYQFLLLLYLQLVSFSLSSLDLPLLVSCPTTCSAVPSSASRVQRHNKYVLYSSPKTHVLFDCVSLLTVKPASSSTME